MLDFILSINWNVSPFIFETSFYSLRWYTLLFAIGFYIAYNLGLKMYALDGVDEEKMNKLMIYIFVGTVFGARIGHCVFYEWSYYKDHIAEIILPFRTTVNGVKFTGYQGLASHGGAIGIFITVSIYAKKVSKTSVWWVLDRVVVPTALVGGMIRLGNLFNSEIYGIQTALPWGMIFERNGETIAKHPTQIYESLCYVISFFVLAHLFWKTDKRKHEGFITGLFFILIFTARFFIEFIKEAQEAFETTMVLNMGQWLSIPLIILGIYLIISSKKRPLSLKTS
ncbi:MAG: prolipoprotein diacylglyceryl transferase [Bacteroidales bacterium]